MPKTPLKPNLDFFLRRSLEWSKCSSPALTQKLADGAWHIINVDLSLDPIGLIHPALSETQSKAILGLLKQLAIKSKDGPIKLVIEGRKWLILTFKPSELQKAQIGRQVGIDAAGVLKDLNGPLDLVYYPTVLLGAEDFWQGLALGWGETNVFKKANPDSQTGSLTPGHLCFAGPETPSDGTKEFIKLSAAAAVLMKDLGDAPPNWLDPAAFLKIAQTLLPEGSGFSWEVLNKKDLQEKGLGAMYSVAQGSDLEAYLAILKISGKQKKAPPKVIVGKGLCFDSGGYNIKNAGNQIEDMKYDMCGAAAVLGTAWQLKHHKPPQDVYCVMGLVENMLSAQATKPGSIVQSFQGKTIDILNTDAEGRLVLCDAIAYVLSKTKPSEIYTIATLTGGVIMALGEFGAAVLSPEPGFAYNIQARALDLGEPLWTLPIWPEIKKDIKARQSDLYNISRGKTRASTILAAAFLEEFLPADQKDLKWAHFDICGVAWNARATGYPAQGGSAYGFKLLFHLMS